MHLPAFIVIKILVILIACFVIAMAWAPFLIRTLRKWKMGKSIRDTVSAPIAAGMHAAKEGTPNMGGLVIWMTVAVVMLVLAAGCSLRDQSWCSWSFLSRAQTLLPLGALIAAALVGFIDAYLNVKKIGPTAADCACAIGFCRTRSSRASARGGSSQTQWDSFHVPFVGTYELGWWYVPIFVFVIIATSNAVNITAGLDGLAG